MKLKKYWLVGTLLVILLTGGLLVGFKPADNNFIIKKNVDILYTLMRELDMFYVDSVETEKIFEKGITEMLSELDPYTTFIPEEDMADFRFMTTGKYGGIGSLIGQRDSFVMVTDPYEGKPAQRNGLRPGDRFLEINGKNVVGKKVSDISDLLKGVPGTQVEIKVLREGERKPVKFAFNRETISISPVPYYGMLENKTGYIRFSNFTDKSSKYVKDAVVNLKKQGAEALILDLRSNPGGILDEAVNIANLFIPKGEMVVYTKGKIKQWDKTYVARQEPLDTEIPLAVMVNSGSASASEIVAGALQDLDRAVVLGKRTFGKGLVQTTRPLSFNSKLKVTTAKYFIPSGRCIQALDYNNRNDDGSVGKIPDSLITVFNTRNGREVKDGGGVMPDVTLDYEKPASLTISLIRNYLLFDYATTFAINNEEIGALKDFSLSDAEYNKFVDYVKGKDFSYKTSSEEKLKELIKVAKLEGYFGEADEELKALENKLAHDVSKDIQMFKDEIKEQLELEIIKRYYYQKGEIIHSLKSDKWIKRAIQVLDDQPKYAKILAVKE